MAGCKMAANESDKNNNNTDNTAAKGHLEMIETNRKRTVERQSSSKNRRSLFSLLFSSKSNGGSKGNANDENNAEVAGGKSPLADRDTGSATSINKCAGDGKQYVIIKAKEAKCIEATISSSQSVSPASEFEWGSRLPRAKIGRGGGSPSDKDEDANSYVLDLNDQLAKSRAAGSPTNLVVRESDEELNNEAQHLDRSCPERWHTNANYIPAAGTPRESAETAASDKSRPVQRVADQRHKSPLLEKFHEFDRIRLDSSRLSMSSSESSSSCDSLLMNSRAAKVSERGTPHHHHHHHQQPNTATFNAPEQRLEHWKNLALRQTLITAALTDHEAAADSDSDLELIGCDDSPALVCYCSDDTSCSSVELVWSRPRAVQALGSVGHDASKLSPPPRLVSQSPSHESSTSPVVLCRIKQQKRATEVVQKASILELAKPSRARDRRIGSSRRSHGKTGAKLPESRHSIDQRQQSNSSPPVGQRTSGDWVANPLFSTDLEEVEGEKLAASLPVTVSNDDMAANITRRIGSLMSRMRDGADEPVATEQTSLRQTDEKGAAEVSQSPASSDKRQAIDLSGRKLATDMEKFDELARRIEREEELERGDSSYEFNGDALLDEQADMTRKHHQRWSVRMRSPFGGASHVTSYSRRSISGGLNSLNHLINLDRRIKTNVSSIKSQLSEKLSDTGKRASVLADQLLSTIKDTTREQALANSKTNNKDHYETLPNSFATRPNLTVGQDDNCSKRNSFVNTTNVGKSELFSLIYKHQQQNVNGQPVITRQPVSIASMPIGLAGAPAGLWDDSTIKPASGKLQETGTQTANETKAKRDRKSRDIKLAAREAPSQSSHTGRLFKLVSTNFNTISNEKSTARGPTRPKRRLMRKFRRQVNVALESDDEDNARDAKRPQENVAVDLLARTESSTISQRTTCQTGCSDKVVPQAELERCDCIANVE